MIFLCVCVGFHASGVSGFLPPPKIMVSHPSWIAASRPVFPGYALDQQP